MSEHKLANSSALPPSSGSVSNGMSAPVSGEPITLLADTVMPTVHGDFRVHAYLDPADGIEHLALIAPAQGPFALGDCPLVRVHSECITGEAFGSLKCECGPQLQAALSLVHEKGGVVIYLRGQEGRGIGLGNKLRAYQLQEQGLDTLDANLKLGFPADARDYTAAAKILAALGLSRVCLLTNNPDKAAQLEVHGITVEERVPLFVGLNKHNAGYLETKQQRMGHLPPS